MKILFILCFVLLLTSVITYAHDFTGTVTKVSTNRNGKVDGFTLKLGVNEVTFIQSGSGDSVDEWMQQLKTNGVGARIKVENIGKIRSSMSDRVYYTGGKKVLVPPPSNSND